MTGAEGSAGIAVIVPKALESRDRIIRAINSQTIIPPASLRATDRIHRDIEEYLKPFGFYYDRRKNFYKNEGKPIRRIISIPQLAQTVTAIVLKRPHTARASPSSLIKRDDDYQKLFTSEYPIEIYRACAQILKSTEAFLRERSELFAADRNNLKFYVTMAVVQIMLRHPDPTANQIATLAGKSTKEEEFLEAYDLVNRQYSALGRTDKVAKGPEMSDKVKGALESRFTYRKSV